MGTHDHLKARALSAAQRRFGQSWHADAWTIAPGRIELIGNHIDYNGGPVLAGAVDKVITVGVGSMVTPSDIAFVAADISSRPVQFNPGTLGDWRASHTDRGPIVYVKGIIAALLARSIPFRTGVVLSIAGDIPRGFGMSSSAAFCIATTLALTIDEITPHDLVTIAREAEHRAGSPVGAMDQSASVAGGVILFDGRNASYTQMTPELGDHIFAVADSGVARSLRTSSYGTRVNETAHAREIISEKYDVELEHLCDLTMDDWRSIEPNIHEHLDEHIVSRVRHAVYETNRVLKAKDALVTSDWKTFGNLMNESGHSSAADYDISHPDVETLVDILRNQEGVLGARMMGGGEGGPALALLHRDVIDDVGAALEREFYTPRNFKREKARFQVCAFGEGAHRGFTSS